MAASIARKLAEFASKLSLPIPLSLGGTGRTTEDRKGYIDGFQLEYSGRTALSVKVGAAYIPSLGRVVEMTTEKNFTGIAGAGSSFYHVYLFENGGVADVELSLTVPVKYFGKAYNKTGATTHRYLGSFLTNGSGQLWAFRHDVVNSEIVYLEGNPPTAPFKVTDAWGGTTPSVQTTGFIVPVETTTHIHLGVQSTGLNYFFSYEQASPGDAGHFMTVVGATNNTFNVLSDIWVPLSRIPATLGRYLVSVQAGAGCLTTTFCYGYRFER